MRAWLAVLLLLFRAPDAFAHEVRPAYLQVQQTSAGTYEVLWKVPGRGDVLRLGLYWPCDALWKIGPVRSSFVDNAFTERWKVKCTGGLTGGHDSHSRSRCHDDGRAGAPRAARRYARR